MEQYKPHPEHSHLLVYRDGRIYSTKRNRFVGCLERDGYVQIKVIRGLDRRAHSLVMETWGSDAPSNMEDPTIDHIDENKLNNSIDNLRWLSREENGSIGNQGIKNPHAKLTEQHVKEIRTLRNKDPKFYTHAHLGELYSVDRTTIRNLCNRKTWTHI